MEHSDWRKSTQIAKFGKYQKITHTEDIMKWEKSRRPAGPTSYDTFIKDFNKGPNKPLGNFRV